MNDPRRQRARPQVDAIDINELASLPEPEQLLFSPSLDDVPDLNERLEQGREARKRGEQEAKKQKRTSGVSLGGFRHIFSRLTKDEAVEEDLPPSLDEAPFSPEQAPKKLGLRGLGFRERLAIALGRQKTRDQELQEQAKADPFLQQLEQLPTADLIALQRKIAAQPVLFDRVERARIAESFRYRVGLAFGLIALFFFLIYFGSLKTRGLFNTELPDWLAQRLPERVLEQSGAIQLTFLAFALILGVVVFAEMFASTLRLVGTLRPFALLAAAISAFVLIISTLLVLSFEPILAVALSVGWLAVLGFTRAILRKAGWW